MLLLEDYVVKTKLFESLTCHYLIGNTIYCSYTKGRSRPVRGTIDLSVDSHSFQPFEGEWPKPILHRISPVTLEEGFKLMGFQFRQRVSDKLLGKEPQGIKLVDFYHEMFKRLTERLMEELKREGETHQFVLFSSKLEEAIREAEYAANLELESIREQLVHDIRSREVNTLTQTDRAMICNLIEVSCGKNKLHQSFSDLGLDLKLISDPDNVTGALRFEGGKTLEEAFLQREQD